MKQIIYHGSDHIINAPEYGFGSGKNDFGSGKNDFGKGFYCTETPDLAKEWACKKGTNGFANAYELDITDLRICNLNSDDYTILNWLALLTRYRGYWQRHTIAEEAKDYLQEHFLIDYDSYDIIIGYRADDSYFSFAQDFIAGTISLQKLSQAMKLGKPGEQVVLKSPRAFEQIEYLKSEIAFADEYYTKKVIRDRNARHAYAEQNSSVPASEQIYMLDIIRGMPMYTKSAYDELYLPLAQRLLGDMYDFAVNTLGITLNEFQKMFLVSDVSKQIERGNPMYIAGRNGCEVAREVVESVVRRKVDTDDEMYADKSPEYWIGWTLAYYQWCRSVPFELIEEAVPIEEMLLMYPTLHEADITISVEIIDEKIQAYNQGRRLRRLRSYAGLSQQELADRSGVALRQIQLFEQGQRDIRKTQGITLMQLAKTLGCHMEDLM